MSEMMTAGCVKDVLILRACEADLPYRQVERWYDAVYGDPDTSHVEWLMQNLLPSITLGDVANLADAFDQDPVHGIKKSIDFFWKLFKLEPIPELVTYAEWVISHPETSKILGEGSMMSYYYELDSSGDFPELCFLVEPSQFRCRPKGDLLVGTAHESVYGLQSRVISSAIKAGATGEIDLTRDPKKVMRSELYLLNSVLMVDPNVEGYEAYKHQIIEQEAFLFADKVAARVQDLITGAQAEDIAVKLNRIM